MDHNESSMSSAKDRKRSASFVHNMVTMVWLPGAASAVCLILGLAKMDAILLALAVAGGVGTFIGWCFAAGMANRAAEMKALSSNHRFVSDAIQRIALHGAPQPERYAADNRPRVNFRA